MPHSADSTLTYLHADHLGSASLSTDASGNRVSDMRYYAYGATREGTMPTDRRYTGQRHEAGLGLYDYNARYYDPALGRFIQADTIVPEPGNPQALNRYTYTFNNPLRYTDPTGHLPDDELASLLGFETVKDMLKWGEAYPEWFTMARNGAFTYGAVLVSQIGESSIPVQLMLLRTSSGDPVLFDLGSHAEVGGILLSELAGADQWALFERTDSGYNPSSFRFGTGSNYLPGPTFDSGYWGEWNKGPGSEVFLNRPNAWLIAQDVVTTIGKGGGLVCAWLAALGAEPGPFAEPAAAAATAGFIIDLGLLVDEVANGRWKGPDTFIYEGPNAGLVNDTIP